MWCTSYFHIRLYEWRTYKSLWDLAYSTVSMQFHTSVSHASGAHAGLKIEHPSSSNTCCPTGHKEVRLTVKTNLLLASSGFKGNYMRYLSRQVFKRVRCTEIPLSASPYSIVHRDDHQITEKDCTLY